MVVVEVRDVLTLLPLPALVGRGLKACILFELSPCYNVMRPEACSYHAVALKPEPGDKNCALMPSKRLEVSRRDWLGAAAAGVLGWAVPGLGAAQVAPAGFSFDAVDAEARALARRPWKAPALDTADRALAQLSYDDYRSLRFRPAESLWRRDNLPFELQFFHVGRGQTLPLRMGVVDGGRVQPLPITRRAFDPPRGFEARFGEGPDAAGPAGIAGFRAHHALGNTGHKDEVIAFLGASYFRALGAGQRYGLSARAVAIDTVGGQGEEFPSFVAHWIERPAPQASSLVSYALLDGPRVTGAYRFVVTPGPTTDVEIQARLHLRAPVATFGLAPLTSMFLAGDVQPVADDFRPEVHDSDGLQVATGEGEWIWRPLTNPGSAFVTSFATRSPKGFGLMQRDRDFRRYEDLEAHYERRPSAWVEPIGDWGPGRVELLQFHTPDETHDNVVAYWVPDQAPRPGQPFDARWRVRWQGDDFTRPPLAWVAQTRRGVGYREGALPRDQLQYHVDFEGGPLQGRAADAAVQAVASGNDNVAQLRAHAYPNPVTGGWRMTLDLRRRDPRRPVELRAVLQDGTQLLSETWSHALAPD